MRPSLKCKDCGYEGNEDHECVSADGFYKTLKPVVPYELLALESRPEFRLPPVQVWSSNLNMMVEQKTTALGEQIADELEAFEEETRE
jgi:hypothetical protein